MHHCTVCGKWGQNDGEKDVKQHQPVIISNVLTSEAKDAFDVSSQSTLCLLLQLILQRRQRYMV